MKLSTQGYKGTRDLYPEDKQLQNPIFSNWHRTSQQFGFWNTVRHYSNRSKFIKLNRATS